MAKSLPTYLTRITWNDALWRHPSKASGKAETGSYVAENGFGHEEWLNRSEWVINGWRYGFLQGVSNSRRRHSGEQVRILLYAKTPAKERRYVGELRRVELVDEKTMNAAVREMRRRGIARQMAEEVRAAGGNVTVFRENLADGLVNVRFRPEDLKFYAEPILASPSDRIQSYDRYQLIEADQQARTEWKARTRAALKDLKNTKAETRTIKGGVVEVDPVENRLQSELWQLLQFQFGKECVEAERDFVDLTVTTPKRRVLLEIKSDATARSAIRAALGQLLDYAYFAKKKVSEKVELVIVGQGASTPESDAYLHHLRETFRIPIRYQQFQLGKKDFVL